MTEAHISVADSIAGDSSLGRADDMGSSIVHSVNESHSSVPTGIIEESRSMSPSAEVPMFTSPPAAYIEPEVPDPFLVDDSASDDDDGRPSPHVSASQQTIMPADEVILSQSPSSSTASTQLSPNRNKAVPPPPSESDPEDEEAPELYLPGLVIPTMFLPIPNVRFSFSFQLTW
jgi:hypothetical protein